MHSTQNNHITIIPVQYDHTIYNNNNNNNNNNSKSCEWILVCN